MTREEAIQVLKEYRTIVMNCLEAETPAFDMAIEALKADAVSREEYNDLLRTKISFANATIPMFAESEEAYKAWTGEEIGKTEPSDIISRKDAINAFWEDSDIRTAEVRATLKALPSADAVSRESLDIFAQMYRAERESVRGGDE